MIIQPSANVKPDSSSFRIVFSKSATSEVAGELNPQTGNGLTATINNTSNDNPTISNLKAAFVNPGETTTYEFYAYNAGEYKSYLTNIAFNKVTGSELTKVCTPGSGTTKALVDAACEGISMHIDIDGLLADTTMETSGHSIDPTESHKVTITMEYDKDAARADGPFTVTFGDIQVTYMSIEGTGTSTGGLTGGSTTQEVEVGGTYTLKDGTVMTVLANSDTVDSYNFDEESETYDVVVLKDGSEWYYQTGNVSLISRYNYYLDGLNKGKMDTTGGVNSIPANQCFCPEIEDDEGNCPVEMECSISEEDFFRYQDEIAAIAQNDLSASLGIPVDSLQVGYPESIQTSVDRTCVPGTGYLAYWAGMYSCGGNGIRVKLTIDKSYILAVLG